MPKSDIQSDLDEVSSKLDITKDANDSFEKDFNKHRVAYGKAHEELWEYKETIDKCQKDLKKASDAKKIQELGAEIEDNEKKFKKSFGTLTAAIDKLNLVGSAANSTERVIKEQEKALDKIEKEMTRAGADGKQLKEWDKTIKGLRKLINAEATRAFTVADEVKNLPKPPKL